MGYLMRHQLRSAGEDAVSPRIITQLVKVSAKVCTSNKTTVLSILKFGFKLDQILFLTLFLAAGIFLQSGHFPLISVINNEFPPTELLLSQWHYFQLGINAIESTNNPIFSDCFEDLYSQKAINVSSLQCEQFPPGSINFSDSKTLSSRVYRISRVISVWWQSECCGGCGRKRTLQWWNSVWLNQLSKPCWTTPKTRTPVSVLRVNTPSSTCYDSAKEILSCRYIP